MKKFTVAIITILWLCSPSLAEPACSGKLQLASASTWSNLVNSDDSLKVQTAKLITEAIKGKDKTSVVLTTVPNKVLKKYKDKNYCGKKLEDTSGNKRLVYKSSALDSTAAVNEWLSGLSAGKTTEGKNLYDKCDKTCSPVYEYIISYENAKFNIKALVQCGHARDKNDNKYKLGISCG